MKTKLLMFCLAAILYFSAVGNTLPDRLRGDYWILPSVENVFDREVHYYDKNPFDNRPLYYMIRKYPDVGYYQIVYYRLLWNIGTGRHEYVPVAREPVYSITDMAYPQASPLYPFK